VTSAGIRPKLDQAEDVGPMDTTDDGPRRSSPSDDGRMGRRSLLVAAAGTLVVGIPIDAAALVGRTSRPRVAAGFSLPNLTDDSSLVSPTDRSGGPALVNFWASWCVPCREEMPILQGGFARFGDRVLFLGVDHKDNRAEALAFVAKTAVQYRSGFDPDGSVANTYGLYGLPTSVLVAADGTVAETVTGALTADRLSKLLSDRLGVR
jgi:thiol-disulfide isomerase/thioredoxin